MNNALQLKNVSKSFGEAKIIKNLNLEIKKNERHAIIGPNGAGKSTLFHLISGHYKLTSGKITLNNDEINNLEPHEINRKGLARSFQVTNIFPKMSVYENIRCGILWSMGFKYSIVRLVNGDKKLNEKTDSILEEINLKHCAHIPAGLLSYADQRALEIGITIAGGADTLMLDEPTAGVSPIVMDELFDHIVKVKRTNVAILMVEQNAKQALNISDRGYVLVTGENRYSGTGKELLEDSRVRSSFLGG